MNTLGIKKTDAHGRLKVLYQFDPLGAGLPLVKIVNVLKDCRRVTFPILGLSFFGCIENIFDQVGDLLDILLHHLPAQTNPVISAASQAGVHYVHTAFETGEHVFH